MPDYASVENAPALNINGGYEEETPLGEVPIGWRFRDTTFELQEVAAGETCPVNINQLLSSDLTRNSWFREVSPQRHPGYRSYVVFTNAAGFFEISPSMFNRMGYDPFNIGQTPPPFTGAFQQRPFSAYADDLDYTMAFSIEVLSGRGRIETYQEWQGGTIANPVIHQINDAGLDATNDKDLVVTQLGVGGWRRFIFTGRFGWFSASPPPVARVDQYLIGPVLRFTKQSQDAFVFRLSACGIYRGHYADVPYAGDLSYLAEPRGIVYISYGGQCPPGFREMELESRFLKITSADDGGELGGSTTHVHSMPVDSVNQSKSSAFQDNPQKDITRASDHSHPIGEGLSVPPSRSVAVCIKY